MPTRLPFEGRIIRTKPPLEGRIVPARPSFKTAWRDLNRRSMTLWLLFFGCIPGMFLLAYVVNDLLLPEEPFLVVTLAWMPATARSEEHTSELQSHVNLVCRLLLEKKN